MAGYAMSKFTHARSSILIASALVSSACATVSPTQEVLPALAVRIEAPAHFRTWFDQTEACSGLSATFEAVEWYVVPGVDSFEMDGEPRVGMWQRVGENSQIVIAGNYVDHEMVVSHEILHHILSREGHPSEMFAGRCQLTWETWASRQAPATVAAR